MPLDNSTSRLGLAGLLVGSVVCAPLAASALADTTSAGVFEGENVEIELNVIRDLRQSSSRSNSKPLVQHFHSISTNSRRPCISFNNTPGKTAMEFRLKFAMSRLRESEVFNNLWENPKQTVPLLRKVAGTDFGDHCQDEDTVRQTFELLKQAVQVCEKNPKFCLALLKLESVVKGVSTHYPPAESELSTAAENFIEEARKLDSDLIKNEWFQAYVNAVKIAAQSAKEKGSEDVIEMARLGAFYMRKFEDIPSLTMEEAATQYTDQLSNGMDDNCISMMATLLRTACYCARDFVPSSTILQIFEISTSTTSSCSRSKTLSTLNSNMSEDIGSRQTNSIRAAPTSRLNASETRTLRLLL